MFEGLSFVQIAVALVGGYLLGSIPFGVIATRLGGGPDLRTIGSGSIGATNVLRTGRKDLAAITLIGDGGKGALAVLLAWAATQDSTLEAQSILTAIAAGAAFLGHLFPVWLRFKGGKGVATFFGTLLAAASPVCLISGAVWLLVFVLFTISSLAALVAALAAPIAAWFLGRHDVAVLAAVMA